MNHFLHVHSITSMYINCLKTLSFSCIVWDLSLEVLMVSQNSNALHEVLNQNDGSSHKMKLPVINITLMSDQ